MNQICPRCERPLWDGGHAISDAECQGEHDEQCALRGELKRTKKALEKLYNASTATHADVPVGHVGIVCPGCITCNEALMEAARVLAPPEQVVMKNNELVDQGSELPEENT